MLRIFCILLLSLILTGHAAVAQQQPDPAFLNRAIPVLQAQRNQALDAAAAQQARAEGLSAELEKVKAEIDKMKKTDGAPKR